MPLLIAIDVICWMVGFGSLSLLERVFDDPALPSVPFGLVDGLLCAILFVLAGSGLRLHQGRYALGSFEEMVTLGFITILVGVMNLLGNLTTINGKGVLVVAGPMLALILMLTVRAAYRFSVERTFGVKQGAGAPALVIGAGEGGWQLVNAVVRHPQPPWRLVGLVDDDPVKRHRRLRGVPMVGTTHSLAAAVERTGAELAIIAIPSLGRDDLTRIHRAAVEAGVDVKVLPGVADLLGTGGVDISDVRDIDVTDLLGRHAIDTDVGSIAGYLTGKRVLVTGAGGSIGSELCRQISPFDPAELIMLDRDESALHAVQLSLTGRAMLDDDLTVLGNIRDQDFVDEVFRTRRPEVVFHAAALKHLPLLERYPAEAIKTNVWGTLNILRAAQASGVERFVNISTDKAANPCSVLGYSKRLAEGLTAAYAAEASGTFLSVRFGNVLGSRGSVLTAFAAQIANGGPVTVTDPQVTRYFMTIAEAVQLVIQAAAIGRAGEALVLDMGDPVRIDDVARQLIELSGKSIDIVYTGLRDGEKLHEELFADGEPDIRHTHELISHTRVPECSPREALNLSVSGDRLEVLRRLSDACVVLQGKLAISQL